MPTPEPAQAAPRGDVCAAVALLRERGDRLTGPRRRVLEAMADLPGHPDVAEVHAAVQERGATHLATTYRALEHLCAAGILTHVHLDHAPPRYHFSARVTGTGREHAHAACRGCGAVLDLPAEVLEPAHRHLAERGYRPHLGHTALSVTCPDCVPG
ncbi:transcriptional repressor [uncultured Serinicoccus sp.]|uniref:Fur family transcriptional regulator n=1 Tax=uncultured Serinicoccus sp. TaxID=735514 RepID=UPI002609E97C|nr:transcriptional repressor [uncultured Serinicoccus sp.]